MTQRNVTSPRNLNIHHTSNTLNTTSTFFGSAKVMALTILMLIPNRNIRLLRISQVARRYNLVCVSYTYVTPGLQASKATNTLPQCPHNRATATTKWLNYFKNALCSFYLSLVTLRKLYRSPTCQVLGVNYVNIRNKSFLQTI